MERRIDNLKPNFLRKLDTYLLENHPLVWMSRVHYIAAFVTVMYFVVLIQVFFGSIQMGKDKTAVIFTIIVSLITFFVYAFWTNQLFLFNISKHFGKQQKAFYKQQFLLIITGTFLLFSLPVATFYLTNFGLIENSTLSVAFIAFSITVSFSIIVALLIETHSIVFRSISFYILLNIIVGLIVYSLHGYAGLFAQGIISFLIIFYLAIFSGEQNQKVVSIRNILLIIIIPILFTFFLTMSFVAAFGQIALIIALIIVSITQIVFYLQQRKTLRKIVGNPQLK